MEQCKTQYPRNINHWSLRFLHRLIILGGTYFSNLQAYSRYNPEFLLKSLLIEGAIFQKEDSQTSYESENREKIIQEKESRHEKSAALSLSSFLKKKQCAVSCSFLVLEWGSEALKFEGRICPYETYHPLKQQWLKTDYCMQWGLCYRKYFSSYWSNYPLFHNKHFSMGAFCIGKKPFNFPFLFLSQLRGPHSEYTFQIDFSSNARASEKTFAYSGKALKILNIPRMQKIFDRLYLDLGLIGRFFSHSSSPREAYGGCCLIFCQSISIFFEMPILFIDKKATFQNFFNLTPLSFRIDVNFLTPFWNRLKFSPAAMRRINFRKECTCLPSIFARKI